MGCRVIDEKHMGHRVSFDSNEEHTESVETSKAQYEAHIIFERAMNKYITNQ